MTTQPKYKKGDKVRITSGQYTGQTAVVKILGVDGVVAERNTKEAKRFCPLRFEHLELIETKK
jgi:transcription antitermination factor NusG